MISERALVSEKKLYAEELEYFKPYLREYLACGSVEEVARNVSGTSPATLYRIINKLGIITSPRGRPANEISDIEAMRYRLNRNGASVSDTSRLLNDKGMAMSEKSWHRTRQAIERRIDGNKNIGGWKNGVGLLITQDEKPFWVLLGEEMSNPNMAIGKKYEAITIPIGFSDIDEDPRVSILRVFQREALSGYAVMGELAIGSEITEAIIPERPKPLMGIEIANVTVDVYHLEVPRKLAFLNFDSPKLKNLGYRPIPDNWDNLEYRAGVCDILKRYRDGRLPRFPTVSQVSSFNMEFLGHPNGCEAEPIYLPRIDGKNR